MRTLDEIRDNEVYIEIRKNERKLNFFPFPSSLHLISLARYSMKSYLNKRGFTQFFNLTFKGL